MGVIEAEKPKGIEELDGVGMRTGLLKTFGYKRGWATVPGFRKKYWVYLYDKMYNILYIGLP